MELTGIVLLVVGILAGALIGFLFARLSSKNQSDEAPHLKMELEMEAKRSANLTENLDTLNEQIKSERERLMQLNSDHSSLKANYQNLQQKLAEQKAEVNELQEKFRIEFKNLANEILEEKSKKFTDQNKINIGQILDPLKEKIESFEKKVEQSSKESLTQNTALKTQLDHLKELNQQITKEAESLTRALKGESKTQGNWGEMQLENILEKVGLQKDVHYFKEKNFKSEDGNNQRLDYIIKLPDDKSLVLDSKVSLTAYSNYYDTEDDATRAKYLKQHLDSIYGHIKLLGDKNYQNLYEIQQPDFVLMFVANEPALTLALKEDHDLYEKALDKNIVLVSTSTLLATLRTVSYIWKQDLQNKNAVEIARQAGALYDKFEGFTQDLLKVGGNLKQTKDNYDLAMNKLTEGTGNLVRRTEILRELGAKASKQIDQRLIDRSQS
ncbi:MAG: DNA recombination protein RmuC [Marinoscillum sp.]|jgi:DNA recombination protein RmuC